MKNHILILALLICNLANSQFLSMLSEEHTWSVDVNCSNFGDDPWTRTDDISVSGATVINGKTYKTVSNNHISEIDCLVREENGVVYRYIESINDEVVMYDFTLEVGDSFTFLNYDMYCSIYGGVPIIDTSAQVVFVNTQFIAGENRKVIEFEFFFDSEEIWIEGIGSVRGFDPVGVIWDIIDFTELVCFTNSVNTYFFNGASSCDNTTLSLEDNSVARIVLLPNPVRNHSILKLPVGALIDKIMIVDINGRIIKEEVIGKDYYSIHNMDYSSGLYFYRVFSENKILKTDRFIIN